jgi:hypothetical protein
MFGLDHQIAALGSGQVFAIVAAIAVLLGLRHATDPDHLTAVSTLLAGEAEPGARRAGGLGFAWGLGHASSLLAFGLPIVLFRSYLPEPVQEAAEVAVGIVIVVLAARLLHRWRQGYFRRHSHTPANVRSRRQAFGIGLIHGMGGSAGVGVLLLAAIPNHVEGMIALVLFASFTAVSMAIASTAFGYALSRGPVLERFFTLAPALGVLSLGFGVWYALGAVHAVPYVF